MRLALVLLVFLAGPLWADDPMRPPDAVDLPATGPTGPHWHLAGIRNSRSGRIAHINDRWVRVGDVVDGATVTAMHASGVQLLRDNGKTITLEMLRQPVKQSLRPQTESFKRAVQ